VLLGQLVNAEHFLQCKLDYAVYDYVHDQLCVSVPIDRLASEWPTNQLSCVLNGDH